MNARSGPVQKVGHRLPFLGCRRSAPSKPKQNKQRPSFAFDMDSSRFYDGDDMKRGLGRSQGRQVVDALLKVQEKLRKLESQVDQGRYRKEDLRYSTSQDSLFQEEASQGQNLSLEAMDSRLKLIEGKLDLLAQLMVRNGANSRRKADQGVSFRSSESNLRRPRFQIHDAGLKARFVHQQFQETLYQISEESNYLHV